MKSVMKKAISNQIIRPTSGETRKLPLSSSVTASVAAKTKFMALGEEERDQAEDEGVEHDRLGQGEAEPLDARDLVAHLGLTRDRLDHLAEDVADADARADGAEAGTDAERDGLAGLAPDRLVLGDRGGQRGDDGEVHSRLLCFVSGARRPRRRGRSQSEWRR